MHSAKRVVRPVEDIVYAGVVLSIRIPCVVNSFKVRCDDPIANDVLPLCMHSNVFFPANRVADVINIIRTILPCYVRDFIKVSSCFRVNLSRLPFEGTTDLRASSGSSACSVATLRHSALCNSTLCHSDAASARSAALLVLWVHT